MFSINWETAVYFLLMFLSSQIIVRFFGFTQAHIKQKLMRGAVEIIPVIIHVLSMGLVLVPTENYIPAAILLLGINSVYTILTVVFFYQK